MGNETTIGFFGGKFLPMHVGHKFVLEKAFDECDIVYIGLFVNSPDEKMAGAAWYTSSGFRYYQLRKTAEDICRKRWCYGQRRAYHVMVIDCDKFSKDGKEDWYAEAEYVKACVMSPIHRVYSSEPSYDDFFKKAYPKAKHVLVDPEREQYPISSTKIRGMTDPKEQIRWMI